MEACYAWHYIDFHEIKSHQINDIIWKSALPVTVSIFTNSQEISDTTWKSNMPVTVSIFTKII